MTEFQDQPIKYGSEFGINTRHQYDMTGCHIHLANYSDPDVFPQLTQCLRCSQIDALTVLVDDG